MDCRFKGNAPKDSRSFKKKGLERRTLCSEFYKDRWLFEYFTMAAYDERHSEKLVSSSNLKKYFLQHTVQSFALKTVRKSIALNEKGIYFPLS